MTLFSWVLFGIVAGVAAALMDKRFTLSGLIGALTLGILGSVVGGLLSDLVFYSGEGISGFSFTSFMVAIVGSFFLLFISRIFREDQV